MDSVALQKYLLRLFERHEVELDPDEDGWLVTDGEFPAIRAEWHEGEAGGPGRLDVDIVLDEERRIEESFVGVGEGDAGCRDALRTFEHGVFHVLLAACWYVTDDRRMQIASWPMGVRDWDVFIGPFSLRGVDATDMGVLEQVPAVIKAALEREALTPELHWLRLVHRHASDGESRSEVLLDNELWEAGSAALADLAWPVGAGYSARSFVLLDIRDY